MKRSTENLSVFDLTTRELREEIRKRTASVNATINEYRNAVQLGIEKANQVVENSIRKMREAAIDINKQTGAEQEPYGKHYCRCP